MTNTILNSQTELDWRINVLILYLLFGTNAKHILNYENR